MTDTLLHCLILCCDMQQPPEQPPKANASPKPSVSSSPRAPPPRPPPPVLSRADDGGCADAQAQSETKEGCAKVGVASESGGDEGTDASQPSLEGADKMAAGERASGSDAVDGPPATSVTSATQPAVSEVSLGDVERVQVQSKHKKSRFRRQKAPKSAKLPHEDPRTLSPPAAPDEGSSRGKPPGRGKSFRRVLKKLDLHRGNGSKATPKRDEMDAGMEPNTSEGAGVEKPDQDAATMTTQVVVTAEVAAADVPAATASTPATPGSAVEPPNKTPQVSHPLDPSNDSAKSTDAVKQEKQEIDGAAAAGSSSPKKRAPPSTNQSPKVSPPSPKKRVQQPATEPLESGPASPKKKARQLAAQPQESNSSDQRKRVRMDVSPPLPVSQSVAPSEEEVFPINKIHLCVNGRWLCVGNAGGSVLVFKFDPFGSQEEDASSVSCAEMEEGEGGREGGREDGGWEHVRGAIWGKLQHKMTKHMPVNSPLPPSLPPSEP